MKIILEGNSEQIQNLKKLIQSQSDLPEIREHYYTDNLWCIDDVLTKYNATEDEAMAVLDSALNNEATIDQIWLAIDIAADIDGLSRL